MLRVLCAFLALPLLATAAPVPPADNRASEEALKQAVEVLNKAGGDANTRVDLWCGVAQLRQRLGDRSGALEALREARTISDKRPRAAVESWVRFATVLGRFGEAKAVLDLAATVPEKMEKRRDNPRNTVLQEAATAAAHAGHTRAAEQITEALTDAAARERLRETIRRSVIVARLKAGDATAALNALEELTSAEEKVFALVGRPMPGIGYDDIGETDGIASARLQAGDKDGAKDAALKALALLPDVDKPRRTVTALAVVRVLARLDDVPGAKKALAHIPAADPARVGKDEDRGRATQELLAKGFVAAAEVRTGGDAKDIVKDVSSRGDRAYLLHHIALAQARVGRKDEAKTSFALALEHAAADPEGRGTPHNIASAQALAGDVDGAARTADQFRCSVVTWVNIAHAQIRAGNFDSAREIAGARIARESASWYATILRNVAREQAGAGRAAAVREWAGKLDDELLRVQALLGLAEGLYRAPVKQPAKR
ncbi:hypothetical protein J8F10_04680 [Gemmata sp. G18]|uniref:Tetratricopeptide repeat protein n=1 Tax=Gemmata palustris TaxID=2822762 RepID=A0ABS5BLL5_9BACT|nr:hypothetical protein [Gemmata palustris]MBP3954578.1 hypothetical protein [Gemmata palustris]